MGHNNNDFNYVEYTKIGSFIYALETDDNLEFLEKISRSRLTDYASIDESLNGIENIYVYLEDYVYNILYNYRKGHKLVLKKGDVSGFIDVYSTNYHEVMEQKNIQKVKKR